LEDRKSFTWRFTGCDSYGIEEEKAAAGKGKEILYDPRHATNGGRPHQTPHIFLNLFFPVPDHDTGRYV
jgi:hypothetical protein